MLAYMLFTLAYSIVYRLLLTDITLNNSMWAINDSWSIMQIEAKFPLVFQPANLMVGWGMWIGGGIW